MTDAELMRHIRTSEALTQRAFAAKCGFTSQFVSNIEHGRQRISMNFMNAIKKNFPAYFEQPEPAPAWNPLTVDFAVKVLSDCGWLAKHDKEISQQRNDDGWNDIETPPTEPGMYRTRGYTRSGSFYSGISILYADGYWYTTNGKRMPAPEKWKECKHRVETRRYYGEDHDS